MKSFKIRSLRGRNRNVKSFVNAKTKPTPVTIKGLTEFRLEKYSNLTSVVNTIN